MNTTLTTQGSGAHSHLGQVSCSKPKEHSIGSGHGLSHSNEAVKFNTTNRHHTFLEIKVKAIDIHGTVLFLFLMNVIVTRDTINGGS